MPRALEIALISIPITLAGCVTDTPTVRTDSACVSFGPLTPTAYDWDNMSRHLREQILRYDAAWDKRCASHPL